MSSRVHYNLTLDYITHRHPLAPIQKLPRKSTIPQVPVAVTEALPTAQEMAGTLILEGQHLGELL